MQKEFTNIIAKITNLNYYQKFRADPRVKYIFKFACDTFLVNFI